MYLSIYYKLYCHKYLMILIYRTNAYDTGVVVVNMHRPPECHLWQVV